MGSITITQYRAAIGGHHERIQQGCFSFPFGQFKFYHLFRDDYLFTSFSCAVNPKLRTQVCIPNRSLIQACNMLAVSVFLNMLLLMSGSVHPNPGPVDINKKSDVQNNKQPCPNLLSRHIDKAKRKSPGI